MVYILILDHDVGFQLFLAVSCFLFMYEYIETKRRVCVYMYVVCVYIYI